MEEFDDFDESPLDLDGDGDDAMEMCLFFDDDKKSKKGGSRSPSNSGCCVVFVAIGSSLAGAMWSVVEGLVH